jgi:hypothetical protein
MEQSCALKADMSSASNEIPRLLWYLKVLFCGSRNADVGPCPAPDESSPHPRPSLILSLHLCLDLQNGVFPPGFLTQIVHEFLIYCSCAPCPLILSSLI